jgi:hypothetical protein
MGLLIGSGSGDMQNSRKSSSATDNSAVTIAV